MASRTDDLFRVFLSYRRSDSGSYARNVYDALIQHFGHDSIFYDIDSIAPGRDFLVVLGESLTRGGRAIGRHRPELGHMH